MANLPNLPSTEKDTFKIVSVIKQIIEYLSTATGSITGVGGPGLSTNNAIARWDGTSGDTIQNSVPTISDDGTLTINTTAAAGSTALNLTSTSGYNYGFVTTQTYTGTLSVNQYFANRIAVTDAADASSTAVGGVYGQLIAYAFGGSSAKGGRNALLVQVDVTATTGNTVPNQVAAGLAAIARTAIVDTNINLFGGNFGAVVQAGGQITNAFGSEFNINIDGTAAGAVGVGIYTQGSANPSGTMAALDIGASGGVTPGWKRGMVFGNNTGGGLAFTAAAKFVDTASSPSVDMGIDLSGATIATSAYKSNGFNVDGSGNSTLATLLRGIPVTETNATHTLAATTTHLICNRAGTITVTFPSAASFPGRELYAKTITANTVVSASSNIVPSTSPTAGTAILPATDGAWAFIVSDGANWVIMAANPLV